MTAMLEREVVRGTMTIPDPSGAKVITWDPADDEEVRKAADAFAAAMKNRMTPVRRHAEGVAPDGTMGTVIRDFEPDAAEITMQPRLVGG
jgi:hypothetical protein